MPRRDGTGPEGKGALTGRRLGECKSNNKKVTFWSIFGLQNRNRRGNRKRRK